MATDGKSLDLGVHLYTVRHQLLEDPERAFASIAAIGYRQVELHWPPDRGRWDALRSPKMARLARDAGLEPVGLTLWESEFAGRDGTESTLDRAAAAGVRYLAVHASAVPGTRALWRRIISAAEKRARRKIGMAPRRVKREPDAFRALAARLNRASEKARSAGLSLCFHLSSSDFEPAGDSTPFEILLEELEPELVGYAIDTYWARLAGQSPATLLKHLAPNVYLVHLKDIGAGFAGTGRSTEESFTEIGSGALEFGPILKAADEAGVEHYIVEQDYCRTGAIESLRASFRHLQSIAGRDGARQTPGGRA